MHDETKETCIKIMTAIMFVQPDLNLRSVGASLKDWRDSQWKLFCEGEEPNPSAIPEAEKNFCRLQDLFARLGGVQACINSIRSPNAAIVQRGLSLAVTLLRNGRRSIQDEFLKTLNFPGSQPFFEQLKRILEAGVLKARQRAVGQHEELDDDMQLCVLVFKLMRRLFLAQHQPLQDLFRVQRLNRVSINLICEAIAPLAGFISSLGNFNPQISAGVEIAFEMLAASMSGHNDANQQELASSGLLDLCDRIFDPRLGSSQRDRQGLRRRTSSYSYSGRESRRVVPVDDADSNSKYGGGGRGWEEEAGAAAALSRAKRAATRCVTSFLEGQAYPSGVVNQVLTTLQWLPLQEQVISRE